MGNAGAARLQRRQQAYRPGLADPFCFWHRAKHEKRRRAKE
jgi:hypothetical protein